MHLNRAPGRASGQCFFVSRACDQAVPVRNASVLGSHRLCGVGRGLAAHCSRSAARKVGCNSSKVVMMVNIMIMVLPPPSRLPGFDPIMGTVWCRELVTLDSGVVCEGGLGGCVKNLCRGIAALAVVLAVQTRNLAVSSAAPGVGRVSRRIMPSKRACEEVAGAFMILCAEVWKI